MIRNALRALPLRSLFVGWVLLGMSMATGSGALAAPSPSAPAGTASGVSAAPLADAADTVNGLTPADVLGVQSLGPGPFSSGGATVQAAGAKYVRVHVAWNVLAPTDVDPASFNWSAFDGELSQASSLGYQVVANLGANPDWAASFPRGPINCVAMSRFTDYVTAVVTRYSAAPYNVHYYAFYNEPDSSDGYSTELTCTGAHEQAAFGDHPQDYVDTLHAGYDAVKAVDPNAIVLLGGIAYDAFTTDSSPGPFVESFLDDILTDGAGSYFDVMNFHYYPWYDWRWEGLTGKPGMRGKVQEIQAILASHSLSKPIICSEMGDSSGGQYSGDPRTEDTQAIAVIVQYAQAVAAGVKIGIWYNMNDYNDPYGFGENGLLDYPSYDPKLSLSAYETLATVWPGFSFVRVLDSTELGATNLEGYLFWDPSGGEEMYLLWSADGSSQTITLPSGVTSVVDKFNAPVSHSSTLGIDEQPVIITTSVPTSHIFLPLIMR